MFRKNILQTCCFQYGHERPLTLSSPPYLSQVRIGSDIEPEGHWEENKTVFQKRLSSIIKRFLPKEDFPGPGLQVWLRSDSGWRIYAFRFHTRQDHARWQLCFGNNSTHFQLFTNVLQNDSIESVGLFAIWLQMKWVDWLLSKKIWSQFGGTPQLEAQPQRCAGFSAVFNPVSQYASMQCATLREVEKVNKGTTVRALLLFLAHITQPCPLSPN